MSVFILISCIYNIVCCYGDKINTSSMNISIDRLSEFMRYGLVVERRVLVKWSGFSLCVLNPNKQ